MDQYAVYLKSSRVWFGSDKERALEIAESIWMTRGVYVLVMKNDSIYCEYEV